MTADREALIARCWSIQQRQALQAWMQAHPKPRVRIFGRLTIERLPILCRCTNCGAPALIIPEEDGQHATASYCICPRCSAPPLQEHRE